MTNSELDIIAAKIAEKILFQPRWLKLKPAALYSSIGQKELIKLVENKKVAGFQDSSLKTKPWIFDKTSIDNYRIQQANKFNNDNNEQFALEIINGLDI